ncbi:MAG: choice-of-anchor J domain-containing protein, partial [Candidatus Thermoplasmatota archaeon]|nr:choice-of-anchor J domain-containing protein [Candidatus Thermoplasmatota archaeon]
MNKKSMLKRGSILLVAVAMVMTSITVTANTDETVAVAAKNGVRYVTPTTPNQSPLATMDTFSEGFEGGAIPPGWLNIDYDGDTYIWQTVPAASHPAHSGSYSAMSESFINSPGPGAITPDNWLITPAIATTAASELSYWVAAQDPAWAQEHLEVWVSTTGTTVPGDFTDQIDDYTCPAGSSDYVERVIDLSAYAGENIYLAFRHCECTDWFQIKIDDVTVTNTGTVVDTTPPVTTCTLDGVLEGGIYVSDVTVTLTATDDLSGVNYTMYKLDSGVYVEYTAPFVVTDDGDHTVSFYSVDLAGNIETEKTQEFTIQHKAPLVITIAGGLGVSATIKNNGTEDLTGVAWSIELEGGLIIIGKTKSGTVDIPAG